jgi:zinc transport system ATP-binding protein
MSYTEPIIQVNDLSVERNGTRVIEEAEFNVHSGDYVGVVGPNGGGKTTLLKSILGILPRQSGEIRIFGDPIDSFRQWNRLAFVSQDSINFDVNFPMSVRELISLGRISRKNIARPLKKNDWEKVDEVLEFMGLNQVAERRIGQLSGGQRQRVFVAKAMVRKPEVLILDEPVSGIDAEAQEKFYMRLGNLNRTHGTTILIVSHDLASVFCRMSHVISVNRRVYVSEIRPGTDPNDVLQKVYGDHFHFIFHEHTCEGIFDDEL